MAIKSRSSSKQRNSTPVSRRRSSRKPKISPKNANESFLKRSPRRHSPDELEKRKVSEKVSKVSTIKKMVFFGYISILLMSTGLVYSWSAFQSDLLKHFNWSTGIAAYVFFFANVGQNFVVHMGICYDQLGLFATVCLTACLKLIGNLGMYMVVNSNDGGNLLTNFVRDPEWLPTVFGLCFFLDTQATGGGIILCSMESQKQGAKCGGITKGAIGSLCTASFGFGATIWVYLYDNLFAPDLSSHFLTSALLSSILMLGLPMCISFTMPKPDAAPTTSWNASSGNECNTSGRSSMKSKTPSSSPILTDVMISEEFITLLFSLGVTWGLGLFYVSQLSPIAISLLSVSHTAVVTGIIPSFRTLYYTWGTIGRLVAGPLLDFTMTLKNPITGTFISSRIATTIWLFIPNVMMLTTVVILYWLSSDTGNIMDEKSLLLSLQLTFSIAGLAFGMICTLSPLAARALDAKLAGTLYALSKLSCVVSSSFWIGQASRVSTDGDGYVGVLFIVVYTAIPPTVFVGYVLVKSVLTQKVKSIKAMKQN